LKNTKTVAAGFSLREALDRRDRFTQPEGCGYKEILPQSPAVGGIPSKVPEEVQEFYSPGFRFQIFKSKTCNLQ
jgi:hypothetical protein